MQGRHFGAARGTQNCFGNYLLRLDSKEISDFSFAKIFVEKCAEIIFLFWNFDCALMTELVLSVKLALMKVGPSGSIRVEPREITSRPCSKLQGQGVLFFRYLKVDI